MIYLLGGGGHASVLIDLLHLQMPQEELAILDDNIPVGSYINRTPVVGCIADLSESFVGQAVIAIGKNAIRQKLAERFPNANWVRLIHPRAILSPSVQIGPGTVIMANAVIQYGCSLGRHCIVNTAATIDHEGCLADFVHLAPGTHLAGNVTIGQETFLGTGVAVIPGIVIGKKCIVGAGAVVIRDVTDEDTVAGIPARSIHP